MLPNSGSHSLRHSASNFILYGLFSVSIHLSRFQSSYKEFLNSSIPLDFRAYSGYALTQLHLQKSIFQIRSHGQVLGCHEFGGDRILLFTNLPYNIDSINTVRASFKT